MLTNISKKERYVVLRKKILSCTRCNLCQSITNKVPGYGSLNAKLMFIGEGPGANEDKQGLPFVGAAGKFLDVLLKSIGLDRKKIFITNVVKCRPPNNREPLQEEINACSEWLEEQIRIIQPKIFIPLGRHALGTFLPGKMVSKEHGKAYIYNQKTIFVMYHPAAALYNPNMRSVLLDDMQLLKKFLEGKLKPINLDLPIDTPTPTIPKKAKPLSLFD